MIVSRFSLGLMLLSQVSISAAVLSQKAPIGPYQSSLLITQDDSIAEKKARQPLTEKDNEAQYKFTVPDLGRYQEKNNVPTISAPVTAEKTVTNRMVKPPVMLTPQQPQPQNMWAVQGDEAILLKKKMNAQQEKQNISFDEMTIQPNLNNTDAKFYPPEWGGNFPRVNMNNFNPAQNNPNVRYQYQPSGRGYNQNFQNNLNPQNSPMMVMPFPQSMMPWPANTNP